MSPATFLGVPRRNSTADPDGSPIRGEQPFPKAARKELANAQLRRNLAHATSTIRAKRALVVDEMPDWEALRDAGSAIKTDVMARLPELLEQLEANVTARGGVVHWATDAQEANRIVTDLVRATGATEVVKVKSMATQEIGLNEYLEEHGIAAVETDLAELIVQLAHDKPSHILVPAIHRNRTEVRDIFLAEMADAPADLTDEPRRLAMAAREHLRRKFLTATVAISGANFGIADTGTLCVVESEGNGRMCLTLPQTLITVMGIEKLLPTFTDLEVFLQLLPRSSTGERMNPVHVTVDRRHPRRRAAGIPPDPAGQRAHQRAGRQGRTSRPALHQVFRMPERLPRLHPHRRTRLRLRLPRTDRRHPHPHAHRHRRARRPELVPALRILPLRGLLRRLPGEDRHPHHPGRTPRPGGRRRPAPDDSRRLGRRAQGRLLGDERRETVRHCRKGVWPSGVSPVAARAGSGTSLRRCPGGPPVGTCPPHPPKPSATGGRTTTRTPYRHRARDWSGETMTTSRDTVMDKIRAALAEDGPPIPDPA